MGGFLAEACAQAHVRVADAARLVPLATLREQAERVPPPAAFGDALRAPGVSLVAEIKRASPSRGALAAVNDPAGLARHYAAGGAAAVSVLTEPRHFRGGLDDLESVAAAVRLPVLRKDFIISDYQVWEARAHGAAAVLLIVAALERESLAALLADAAESGLDALVEIHAATEVAVALDAYADVAAPPPLIVGVNARDLSTLQVDLNTFERVRAALPDTALVVAESGVRGPDDVRRAGDAGADAVLVGEHLVTAAAPAAAVRALVEAGLSLPVGNAHGHES